MSEVTDATAWVDCTTFLRSTTATLKPGQMVSEESFSLKNSLSALELMDAKMDSGMQRDSIVTAEKALAAGNLPQQLDGVQLIGILDQLLACEATWYEGQSIGHSLFTCLYLHEDRKYIEHPVLLSYATALLAGCRYVFNTIAGANIYEEEDFINNTFGYSLADETPIEVILADLQETIRQVTAQHAGEAKGDDVLIVVPEGQEAQPILQAVLSRLQMRFVLLLSFMSLRGNPLANKSSEDYLRQALLEVKACKDTIPLGVDPAPGFDESAALLVMQNLPPRQCNILSRPAAMDKLSTMISQLHDVRGVFDTINTTAAKDKGINGILDFCFDFSALNPGILVRSFFLIQFESKGPSSGFLGKAPLDQLVKSSMVKFCSSAQPSKLLKVPDNTANNIVVLTQRISTPIMQLIKLSAKSPSRQWRQIPRLLEDWGILQQESAQMDYVVARLYQEAGFTAGQNNVVHTRPFFCWVVDRTVGLLVHYLLTGFELELFSAAEVPYVSWYMELLLNIRVQNRNFAFRAPLTIKKKHKKNPKALVTLINSTKRVAPLLAPDYVLAEAMFSAAIGLNRIVHALTRMDFVLVEDVQSDFDPEYRRNWFTNRFLPLNSLPQPPTQSIESFDEMRVDMDKYMYLISQQDVDEKVARADKVTFPAQVKLIAEGCKHYASAKTIVKQLQTTFEHPEHRGADIKSLMKVCVTNSLFFMTMKKIIKARANVAEPLAVTHKLTYDFTVSKHFPILKLDKVAA